MKDIKDKKPIGLNFIVGSGTTFEGKPPMFSVITADSDTLLPLNFETHALDLVHANKYDEPKWDIQYNWLDEYNIPDMSP